MLSDKDIQKKESVGKDVHLNYIFVFQINSIVISVSTQRRYKKDMDVNLSELKNKNIREYRKQTKIEAIKAAKEKAVYLLESVGNTTGQLIQVVELDDDDWGWPRFEIK